MARGRGRGRRARGVTADRVGSNESTSSANPDVPDAQQNADPENGNARKGFITQKRVLLRQQIDELTEAINNENISSTQAELRLRRVTALFYEYEELHIELTIIDENDDGVDALPNIRREYYDVASKIEEVLRANQTPDNSEVNGAPMGNSTFVTQQKLLKLPVTDLPKFRGDHESWMSFSNTFLSMIDSRKDISDVVKLLYLKGCVQGAAEKKISHFLITNDNYQEAWNVLRSSYEKKRIVISKYLDNLLDVKTPDHVNSETLSEIIDSVNQTLTSLKNLGIDLDIGLERYTVRIIERVLPRFLREEWEKTLDLHDLPSLKQMFTFLESVAFRFESMKGKVGEVKRTPGQKRKEFSFENRATKTRKDAGGARALVTKFIGGCGYCDDKTHPTFRCDKFQTLNMGARWDAIRGRGLCRNCLRKHTDQCKSTTKCRHCGRAHHTLLHSEPKNNKGGGESSQVVPNRTQSA